MGGYNETFHSDNGFCDFFRAAILDSDSLSHAMHILMIWHAQKCFIRLLDQETIGLDTKFMTMNELEIELWLIFDFLGGHFDKVLKN